MSGACKAISLAFALFAVTAVAFAQDRLEVIALRHRTAEQVLPVLRPLLQPGGAISGQGNQLFIRTSEANLAALRAALDAIDTPLRRLIISVRYEASHEASRSGVEARLDTRSAGVAVTGERGAHDERVDQRIQVTDGGRAFISTGVSRPFRERGVVQTPRGAVVTETTVIQDVASGFEVVPRIVGDAILLDIAPVRAVPGAAPGTVRSGRIETTVRARLGEWVELGGAQGGRERRDAGIASARSFGTSESRTIWVKVEEFKP